MKKVNLLFLCMIAFISCNEEQDLDLSVNQNDAGKEIVLKERDSRYPLILSQRKTKPRNTKSIPTLSFSVSIRPRACFSPSYNKVKSQTKHVWLLTLL